MRESKVNRILPGLLIDFDQYNRPIGRRYCQVPPLHDISGFLRFRLYSVERIEPPVHIFLRSEAACQVRKVNILEKGYLFRIVWQQQMPYDTALFLSEAMRVTGIGLNKPDHYNRAGVTCLQARLRQRYRVHCPAFAKNVVVQDSFDQVTE